MYAELADKNFIILAVAQDAQGRSAAAPWYERAKISFVGLVDERHTVSALYDLVNVPAAVWIDETGKVRRIDEGTYAAVHDLNGFKFGRADYAPMVADWVNKGDASAHVKAPVSVAEKSPEATKAEPAFALGLFYQANGNTKKANQYWARAQALNPDSWNYHRQDWAYTPEEAGPNWQKKFQSLGAKPYYAPIRGLDDQ